MQPLIPQHRTSQPVPSDSPLNGATRAALSEANAQEAREQSFGYMFESGLASDSETTSAPELDVETTDTDSAVSDATLTAT